MSLPPWLILDRETPVTPGMIIEAEYLIYCSCPSPEMTLRAPVVHLRCRDTTARIEDPLPQCQTEQLVLSTGSLDRIEPETDLLPTVCLARRVAQEIPGQYLLSIWETTRHLNITCIWHYLIVDGEVTEELDPLDSWEPPAPPAALSLHEDERHLVARWRPRVVLMDTYLPDDIGYQDVEEPDDLILHYRLPPAKRATG